MSDGKRLSYPEGMKYAHRLIETIGESCQRIRIAGSLRRRRMSIGDVEIVCIPNEGKDLFGNIFGNAGKIKMLLIANGYELEAAGERYIKAFFEDVQHDVFITTPERWGVIFTLRTGSAEFSHKVVTKRNEGGLLPSYLRIDEGRVWHDGAALDTPEEEDFFRTLGMEWLEPEDRGW